MPDRELILMLFIFLCVVYRTDNDCTINNLRIEDTFNNEINIFQISNIKFDSQLRQTPLRIYCRFNVIISISVKKKSE